MLNLRTGQAGSGIRRTLRPLLGAAEFGAPSPVRIVNALLTIEEHRIELNGCGKLQRRRDVICCHNSVAALAQGRGGSGKSVSGIIKAQDRGHRSYAAVDSA